MPHPLVLLVALALATPTAAQLALTPPSSVLDGIPVLPIGANAGAAHWDDPRGLRGYADAVAAGGQWSTTRPDAVTGMVWTDAPPIGLNDAWRQIDASGGTVRVIHVAANEGSSFRVGYSYDGNPVGAQSFTAWADNSSAPSFGQYFDLTLAANEARGADIWARRHAENSGFQNAKSERTPAIRWTSAPLLVSTWLPALEAYRSQETHLMAVGSDEPFAAQLILGFQFFPQEIGAFVPNRAAVPEPQAMLGWTAGVLCVFAVRRALSRRLPHGPS